PARQHEAFADDEILKPALRGDHAVPGWIEVGHVKALFVDEAPIATAMRRVRQSVQFGGGGLVLIAHVIKTTASDANRRLSVLSPPVIARSEATKQSRLPRWRQSGLLRFARNDDLSHSDSFQCPSSRTSPPM